MDDGFSLAAGVEPSAAYAAMRLLVVDDEEVDRLAVRRCLRESGITAPIDEAASAGEALEHVERGGYDCVLLDYYVPGVAGLALLKAIHAAAPALPVVIFTGRGDEEIAVELMKSGAADYLPKAALSAERIAASLRHTMRLVRAAAARRHAEEELREQEARFRTLANAIPQLAWIADTEGRRSWYNDRWYDFSGMSEEESRDRGWERIHHPDHLERARAGQLAAFARGEMWEGTYPLRRHDGVWRWFLARAMPVRDAEGHVLRFIGTNTDITERREAEKALAESEARLRRISDSGMIGVFYWTRDGSIIEANDEFCRMLGWSQEDVSAGLLNWRTLTPAKWQPVDRIKEAELAARGTVAAWEKEFYAKDGERIPVLLGVTTLLDGDPDRGVAVCIDISLRKEAEVERERLLALERTARDEAERATRMRDDVLSIVAHDLRNPVNTIVMSASTMLELPLTEEQRARQLAIVHRAAKGMDRLIRDMLDVSRIESGRFAIRQLRVHVEALLDETVELFEGQAQPRGVVVSWEAEQELPPARGDRERLAQVLWNLIGNALRFTPAGGRVAVRATRVDDAVRISVEDSGSGIAPESLPHVFDRFWQAEHASRAGAGLGLAICKGIVEAHGGRIWVESEQGRGTTFHFTVPVATE